MEIAMKERPDEKSAGSKSIVGVLVLDSCVF
jgi:hypothetical protein